MRRWVVCIVTGLMLAFAVGRAPAVADPVEDFYRGRTITLIVGYTVGGGYDVYARVLARHMSKHIPGNPAIVPQNLAGAGSLRSANYLYNVWTRDGLATNDQIADFAPNASSFIANVPEPAAWALMILGLGGVGATIRRKSRTAGCAAA